MRASKLPNDRPIVKTKYGYHRSGGYRSLYEESEDQANLRWRKSKRREGIPPRIVNRYPGYCVQCRLWVEAESGWAWQAKPRPWTNEATRPRWLVSHATCVDKLKGKDERYSPPRRKSLTDSPSKA